MYGDNENSFIIVGNDQSFEWQRKPAKKKGVSKILKNILCIVLVAAISASATAGSLWYYDTYYRTTGGTGGDIIINQVKHEGVNTSKDDNSAEQTTGGLTVPQIYEQTATSTVLFTCKTAIKNQSLYPGFNYGGQQQQPQYNISYGSGIIMSENGYIITNAHVVDGTSEILVTLYNGKDYTATLVGSDASSDIAVVKIDATGLPAAKFGDSSTMKVGDSAYVVGNPLGSELAFTLTAGFVSSLDREITIEDTLMCLMQIDAAVNPGNSGGSLADSNGLIVGVINAKIAEETVEGIGFAIPINTALKVASELIKNGKVVSRPVLGITINTVTKEAAMMYNTEASVTVTEIQSGSCAEKYGLKVGDKITHFNGVAISSGGELNFEKEKYSVGDTVTMTVIRDGKTVELTLVLSN